MLERIARTCYRRRRAVLAGWLLVLVLAVVAGPALAGSAATGGSLPGTDSQAAYDLAERDFPRRAGEQAAVVFADVREDRAAADAAARRIERIPGVLGVEPLEVSAGGAIARLPVTIDSSEGSSPSKTADAIAAVADDLRADGVAVELSGDWFGEGGMPASEVIGLLAAIVILLVAFGSVVAMGLPILTAVVGIGIGLAGVGITANFLKTPDFTAQVAAMVGIGVGIDYALFIVTRYREALHRSRDPEAATVEAITTSGRAVFFAGGTVVVSLLGMFLMGLDFIHGLAVGTSLAVVIAVAAALTLLPAMLGFVGFRIDTWRIGRRTVRSGSGFWHRWSEVVRRRPGVVAAVGLLVLTALALPTFALRLGNADAGNDPRTSTTYRAYQLQARGFGPGTNGPVFLVADTDAPGAAEALPAVVAALRATPGVVSVSEPQPSESGRSALATLIPSTGPQDEATTELVHRLRDDVVPDATRGTGLRVYLGGPTASSVDFADQIGQRLPIFIGAVLALSFLLLLLVFRSVLVPLKAVLMNLLSIGAAYGVIVAVFQWGWLSDVFGVSPGPVEAWAPMMLFAIVFGLSMDYEVFLLSAVREQYERSHDNSTAVADGLAATARVITAAALIMVCVFGSFVVSDVRALKLVGLGLAVAVAIDATIVRVVLVPATMELLGRANWWLPRWLDRILPRFRVEGGGPAPTEDAPVEPERVPVGT